MTSGNTSGARRLATILFHLSAWWRATLQCLSLYPANRSLTSGYLRISEPKTPAARRAITIPIWLPQVLAEYLTAHPASPDGLLFTAPTGGPIRRNTFRSRSWLPAVTDSVDPPMRFHDLRHSHVALLIQQGTHPAVIAALLGHVSVKTVLDVGSVRNPV